MQFDREKLKAAILYACSSCKPGDLGAVKLHKVLYFADMLQFIHSGNAITGATYRKRPLGPTCDQLLPALKDLEKAGKIRIEDVDYFGFLKKQFTALAEPENRLSEDDKAILDDVVDFVCRNSTARSISEFSHQSPWELAEFGEVIPYTSAFRLIPEQVSEETMQWAAMQESIVDSQRQDQDVAVIGFGDFRGRVLERLGGE